MHLFDKMTKKDIKKKLKNDKKAARIEYRALLTSAEECYRAKLGEAEQVYNKSMDEYYLVSGEKKPQNPPKRPLLEEIGNSITHGLGAVFAIVALVLMLIEADRRIEYISAVIYFLGLFILFMSSCLYHAFVHGSAVKRLFHRFDYSSIYLLIGATFTPVLLCFFGDLFGYVFFGVQWAIIACGITFVGIFGPSRLSFLHIPLYVLLGWSALMLLPGIISVNFPLAMYILGGGILYTLGLIPFLLRSRVSHFIWHFFVLAGAVVQWIGIYLYLFKN